MQFFWTNEFFLIPSIRSQRILPFPTVVYVTFLYFYLCMENSQIYKFSQLHVEARKVIDGSVMNKISKIHLWFVIFQMIM